ncbi:MAG: Abi family protein [Pseudomonadota bacterium]
MLEIYKKPPLTYEQQLNKLRQQGVLISNSQIALDALTSVSYYRLSGYWYPYRIRASSKKITSQIIPGTTFEQILKLYNFDRQLRLLILDAIERIEVAIRNRITYHMAHTYGEFAHTCAENFHPNFNHRKWITKIEDEAQRSSDEFIRHYKNKYLNFPKLPIWMVTETMSLGALSFFYMGMKNNKELGIQDKKKIADCFNIHYKRLGNWLHTITYIRNICAHHSRLWNRELSIRPDICKDRNWQPPITPRNDRIFYVLLLILQLFRSIENQNDWKEKITTLIDSTIDKPEHRIAMGLPEDWMHHPLWK